MTHIAQEQQEQQQQECQQIVDFLLGLYSQTEQYQALVATTPALFAPEGEAHRLLAYFWIYRFHFPPSYRQWPPSPRLLAMFEGKSDEFEVGGYDPEPFLREHQRLLPRSLSSDHPYPWHLAEDERLVREAEEDRQALWGWVCEQRRGASVDEQNHLGRVQGQLGGVPFRWREFLHFVQREWRDAETRVLSSDHGYIVAQHAIYQRLREQLARMGRLA